MKKLTSVITLLSIMMNASGNIYFSTDTLYPHTAVVSKVDYKEDTVYCEDFNGHVWMFTECDDWNCGDIVSMIMDTNGTDDDITDDEIVSVKYSGYIPMDEPSEDELFTEYLNAIESGNYEE